MAKWACALLVHASVAHAQSIATTTQPPPVTESAPTLPPAPVIDLALIQAIVAQEIAKQPKTAGWKDGFFIQTADGTTRLQIGGYTQFDGRFFVADSADPHVDQFGFRSIRPELKGSLLDHYDFRILPDFAGSKLVMQDVHVDVRYCDEVKLRFGKFKVPFGLERLQNEVATTFIDRGMPSQLTPNRDLGAQVFGELAHGLVAYQVGVFNGVADGQSGDGDTSDAKEGTARVVLQPIAGLALGVAGTYGDKHSTLASPDVPQYKTQAQTTFFQLVDAAVADGVHWRVTAHGYYYDGPLGVMAEYVRSVEHVVLDGSHAALAADSWQVLGQWVVTGDPATYQGIVPMHPFDPAKRQWGAFGLALRIAQLRILDASLFEAGYADPTKSASRSWSIGGGIDWYANHNFRFMLDVDHTWYRLGATTGDRPAESSIIGRVQTVF